MTRKTESRAAKHQAPDRRHTVAFLAVLLLLAAVAAALPFALASVVDDVRHGDSRIYAAGDATTAGASDYQVDVQINALNDAEGTVSLRATATRNCLPACAEGVRLAFFSAIIQSDRDLLPVQQWLIFPPGIDTASDSMRLPVLGDPILYPFDSWQLALIIVPEHVDPDGSLVPLRAGESGGAVTLTIASRVPRLQMTRGQDLRAQYNIDLSPYHALFQPIGFQRPLYLKVLTVALVLLVTAAAAYAVFLRPLDQLIINAGALVLGIWGVRAILLGTTLSVVTLVDLMLMTVILFLLAIITMRTLWLLEEQSYVRLLRRGTPPAPDEEPARPAPRAEGAREAVSDLVPGHEPVEQDFPPVKVS